MICEFPRTREYTNSESAVMNTGAAVRFGPQSVRILAPSKMSAPFLLPHLQAIYGLLDRIESEHVDAEELAQELRRHFEAVKPWLGAPSPIARIEDRALQTGRPSVRLRKLRGRYATDEIPYSDALLKLGITAAEEKHFKKSLSQAEGIEYDEANGIIRVKLPEKKHA